MALPVEVKVQAVPHVPVHLVKRLPWISALEVVSPPDKYLVDPLHHFLVLHGLEDAECLFLDFRANLLDRFRRRALPRFPALMASSDSSLRFRYNEVSRVPLLNFSDTRSSYTPRGRLRVASRSPSATCPPLRSGAFRFDHPSRFDGLLLASWCLNTGHAEISIITRLYEGDSLALSLIRSSGETRTHRSPFARPAILTVRRLLYSNGFLPPFSSAEFYSAYLTPR